MVTGSRINPYRTYLNLEKVAVFLDKVVKNRSNQKGYNWFSRPVHSTALPTPILLTVMFKSFNYHHFISILLEKFFP